MIPARGPQTVKTCSHSICIQSARKPYKTCAFCNILLKMLKNHWFSFVFGPQSAKIIEKLWANCIFSIGVPIGVPPRTAGEATYQLS